MADFYIIAGCNGAGKTTASVTILPELLNCSEFVNADNIAKSIAPLNVESAAIEAGRVMLNRVNELLEQGSDFAKETTLTTKSYVALIKKAHQKGYKVTLLYIWLSSYQMAIERVAERVKSGGHHIPDDVVERRYHNGIKNFFTLFMPICNSWILADNSNGNLTLIGGSEEKIGHMIQDNEIWDRMQKQAYGA